MAKVIKISDSDKLVPTEQYPYAKWEFKEFNPVQSRLFEIYCEKPVKQEFSMFAPFYR